jgi:DNA helicase-2/ATP-dependent DNA helicase PcrA
LEQIAAGYASRERFLTELTLDPPDTTTGRGRAGPVEEDYTVLSTIHSAKGQEWRNVRILNVVDGCIPSSMAASAEEIEEERRLLYVAMTRAKDILDLIVPHRSYNYQQAKFGDGHSYTSISQFIPKSIRHLFDCQHWHERSAHQAGATRKSGPTTDVSANLLRIWR